ncbi:MAG: hypothetical protein HYW78_02090 [Parcubacteria group bacterium]|nr:hypothetical protein [Parcubacteria group bacterium]
MFEKKNEEYKNLLDEFLKIQEEARKAKEKKQSHSYDLLEIDSALLDEEALQLWWLIENIKTIEEYEMVKMRFAPYRLKTQNDPIKRKQWEPFVSYIGNRLMFIRSELYRKKSIF